MNTLYVPPSFASLDPASACAAEAALRAPNNPAALYTADTYEDLLLDWADESWFHGDDDCLAVVWAEEVSRG